MKGRQSICRKALLPLLCMTLLLPAGCGGGGDVPEEETKPAAKEVNEDIRMDVTVVNASGAFLDCVAFGWYDSGMTDMLIDLGRDMAPEEILTFSIPKTEDQQYKIRVATESDTLIGNVVTTRYIPEGGVIIVPPCTVMYNDEIQVVYEPGTDYEAAREMTLAQIEEILGIVFEKEDGLGQEEIDKALKALGYTSIEEMRTKKHRNITADADQREEQAAFCDLYGYWYPNGDRNSLTYIAITDEKFMWYQFDPEQGDVELGKMRLVASSGGVYKCTFTLGDGNKFTVECTSLFQVLSEGTLTFEDCTKDYSSNAEYYCSMK